MTMINNETLNFLANLKENNSRDWFEKNKTVYENSKQNVIDFADNLLDSIKKIDENIPKSLEAKKTVLRIYRDVRFSKNKQPYKNNFSISISANTKVTDGVMYFIHIEPNNSFIAGGYWRPETNHLKAIRQEIDYNTEEFLEIIKSKKFIDTLGELERLDVLKLAPKGCDSDHPYIDILKLKSFVVSVNLSDKEITSEEGLKKMIKVCEEIYPLNNFLRKAIDI